LAFIIGPGNPADAASVRSLEPTRQFSQAIDVSMPMYKPRKGAPLRGRVDGGFRGGGPGEPVLRLLAPADHVGETIKKSPTLYWFISEPTSDPITFTLEDSRSVQPILEVPLKPTPCAGVHVIRLADYNVSLEEEVQYRAHVSLIRDPESRSKDIHAMAFIERIPYVQAIAEGRTTCKDSRDVFCLYVESGLWYDALHVISDLITAYPKDRVLRLQRAALLDQVGLADVAQYDRMESGQPCTSAMEPAEKSSSLGH
jgi:hypothetical protein